MNLRDVINKLCVLAGKDAFEFVTNFRKSEDYQQLLKKDQQEMTADELVCFALTTDDISKIRHDIFYRAISDKRATCPNELTASLLVMYHAMVYHHTQNSFDLFSATLKDRSQMISPAPAFMNLAGINLESTSIEAAISNTNLENAHLRNATLGGDISFSSLQRADMENVTFINCKMTKSDFTGANLSHSKGKNFSMCECILNNANLAQARLTNNFGIAKTHFIGANLNGAFINPRNHVTFGLNFTNSSLIGTVLETGLLSTNLTNARLLSPEACKSADSLKTALDKAYEQIQTHCKYVNLKAVSRERELVQAALKNVLESVKDTNLLDLAIEHPLFQAKYIPEFFSKMVTGLRLFDYYAGYKRNTHILLPTEAQQLLRQTREQITRETSTIPSLPLL